MTDMVLPQFGMGMADGTIIAWHKAVGDAVIKGEPLCDVEAAKTTVEVGAPCDGVLQQILVPSGSNVPVNTVIAVIGDAGDVIAVPVAPVATAVPVQVAKLVPATVADPVPPVAAKASLASPAAPSDAIRARPGNGPQVEPRARRAARQHNLDLTIIRGSGPGGRIIEEDVLRAAQALHTPAAVAGVGASQAVAGSHLASGLLYQVRMRCDAAPLTALLAGISEAGANPISVMAMLVKASALALAEAGLAEPSIGVRGDDGGLRTLLNPQALSTRGIDDQLSGKGEASQPSLILESLGLDGIDEIIRLDPASPASLSISAMGSGGGSAPGEWRFTLTCVEASMGVAMAKQFLVALRQLLEKPLAILA